MKERSRVPLTRERHCRHQWNDSLIGRTEVHGMNSMYNLDSPFSIPYTWSLEDAIKESNALEHLNIRFHSIAILLSFLTLAIE